MNVIFASELKLNGTVEMNCDSIGTSKDLRTYHDYKVEAETMEVRKQNSANATSTLLSFCCLLPINPNFFFDCMFTLVGLFMGRYWIIGPWTSNT